MPKEGTESREDSHVAADENEESENNEDDERERNNGMRSSSRQSGRATYQRYNENVHPDDHDHEDSSSFGEMIDEYGSYIFAFFTVISIFSFAVMLSFAK